MSREFSKAFKRDTVSLVIEQGYSRVEAARSLDIHTALLGDGSVNILKMVVMLSAERKIMA